MMGGETGEIRQGKSKHRRQATEQHETGTFQIKQEHTHDLEWIILTNRA